jgi:hypothetical protein
MTRLDEIELDLFVIRGLLELVDNDLKTCNSIEDGIELERRIEEVNSMLEKARQDLLH